SMATRMMSGRSFQTGRSNQKPSKKADPEREDWLGTERIHDGILQGAGILQARGNSTALAVYCAGKAHLSRSPSDRLDRRIQQHIPAVPAKLIRHKFRYL